MTQFAGSTNPYDAYGQQLLVRKTSGLAITALVLSVVGIIPCCGAITAPLGVILGVIAAVLTGPRGAVKGRGLAIAAIMIGVLFTVLQVLLISWVFRTFMAPVRNGPIEAMRAGFSGNIVAFKQEFHGPGAAASDDEVREFINTLRSRYGEFTSIQFDQQKNSQPQFGQPEVDFFYVFTFTNGTRDVKALRIFFDQGPQGGLVNKWGSIEIIDPAQGNVRYPSKPVGTSGSRSPTAPPVPPTQPPADDEAAEPGEDNPSEPPSDL